MMAQAAHWPDPVHELDAQPILIVDDEPALAEELSEAMALHGYRCFVAKTEEHAIDIFFDNQDIETVVVDFYLQGGHGLMRNGLDLVDRLRTLSPMRQLDCVVISGDPDIVVDCTMSGVTKFLPKPIHPDSLLAMLRQPAQMPIDGPGATIPKLQRRIAQQSEAIANLSRKIAEDETRAHETGHDVDLLISAACLLREMTNDHDHREIRDLAQYIVDLTATQRGGPEKREPRAVLSPVKPLSPPHVPS